MVEKLPIEPCPFCGCEDVSIEQVEGFFLDCVIDPGEPVFYVSCDKCDAAGPECDKDEAISKWNARHADGHFVRKASELTEELKVTDALLNERQRVLDAIPECKIHGSCVPHAIEWIESAKQLDGNIIVPKSDVMGFMGFTHVPGDKVQMVRVSYTMLEDLGDNVRLRRID